MYCTHDVEYHVARTARFRLYVSTVGMYHFDMYLSTVLMVNSYEWSTNIHSDII